LRGLAGAVKALTDMLPDSVSPPARGSVAPKTALIITIDGPAGCGKSTVAKDLAKELGITYLDTGATYRSLAYAAMREKVNPSEVDQLVDLARHLPLELSTDAQGDLVVRLGGKDVSREIRTEAITEAAANISQHPNVRAVMVKRQREFASRSGFVVEGRDTGSVVFPDAPHKFFLDATPSVRAKRRQQELARKYGSKTPLKEIQEQLEYRDALDKTRKVGALVKPKGAVAIDTSHRTPQQTVRMMIGHIRGIKSK